MRYFNFKNTPTHASAHQIKNKLSTQVYYNFLKLGSVRNPWDWQVSLYNYALNTHYHHSFLTKKMKNFDEYLQWRVTQDIHLQKEFIVDNKGEMMVDFVGKVENIHEDFKIICERLNIKGNLPHINKTKTSLVNRNKNYRTYYNSKSKELVFNAFREDIDLFGYSFDY